MRYRELYWFLKAVSSCNTPATCLAEHSAVFDLCLHPALTSFRCGAHFSTAHLIHSCRRTREFRSTLGVYKPEFWFGLCVAKTIQSHRLCSDCVLFPTLKCQTLSLKIWTEISSLTTRRRILLCITFAKGTSKRFHLHSMTCATLGGLLMPTIERRKALPFQYQAGTRQDTVWLSLQRYEALSLGDSKKDQRQSAIRTIGFLLLFSQTNWFNGQYFTVSRRSP
jgi:hypothetical protein